MASGRRDVYSHSTTESFPNPAPAKTGPSVQSRFGGGNTVTMLMKNYEVIYITSEDIDQVRKRLKSYCRGSWKVRRRSFLTKTRRRFRIIFEDERDVSSLFRHGSFQGGSA